MPVSESALPEPYARLLAHYSDMTGVSGIVPQTGHWFTCVEPGTQHDGDSARSGLTYRRRLWRGVRGYPHSLGGLPGRCAPRYRGLSNTAWHDSQESHDPGLKVDRPPFFEVQSDAMLSQLFGLPLKTRLFGRLNQLMGCDDTVLAEVVEILPGQRSDAWLGNTMW